MPRGDGSGPMGMGPMTGRGAGFCTGFTTPGYANPTGYGYGLGRGRGFRRMFFSTGLGQNTNAEYYASTADERELLKRQATALENQLRDIKKRFEGFED